MLKETITFKDFAGKEHTEDHYFHLSKAEITLMTIGQQGGLEWYIDRLTRENNNSKIVELFKEIIDASYGIRVPGDERQFIKTPEALQAFKSTDAYSELIMKLFSSPTYAADFIRGLMPEDVQAMAREQEAKPGFRPGFDSDYRPGQHAAEPSAQPQETTPRFSEQVQPTPPASPTIDAPTSVPTQTVFQEPATIVTPENMLPAESQYQFPAGQPFPGLQAPRTPDQNQQ